MSLFELCRLLTHCFLRGSNFVYFLQLAVSVFTGVTTNCNITSCRSNCEHYCCRSSHLVRGMSPRRGKIGLMGHVRFSQTTLFLRVQAVNLITCDALESPSQEVISQDICISLQCMKCTSHQLHNCESLLLVPSKKRS